MTKEKPLIGFTSSTNHYDLLHKFTRFAIWLAGGRAVRLHSKKPNYDLELDGLVVSGGTDLHPSRFRETAKPKYIYDEKRDELEFAWIDKADKADIPILAICRGAQVLNVARGGSLHMNVAKVYEKAKYPGSLIARVFYRKTMHIADETLLRSVLKTDKCDVNSMHVQSVDRLGDNLVISGQEKNGVVQGIEDPYKKFVLGVQFHPEVLIYQKRFRNLFSFFIECTKMRRSH